MQIDKTSQLNREQLEQVARQVGYEPSQDDRDDDLRVIVLQRKAA